MVGISVEYRLGGGKDKLNCLRDAKSAMRYIKKNAEQFGVNPEITISAGGSAGGSLAGALGTSKQINEDTDDLSISPMPKAMVLFNPVGIGGRFTTKKGWDNDLWPVHNIHSEMPPVLVLIGEKDKYNNPETVKKFQKKVQDAGVRCEIEIYEDQEHSFFNNNRKWVVTTLSRADAFIASLGILEGKPTVEEWTERQQNSNRIEATEKRNHDERRHRQ
jgi:acetyl esterase/lipase